MRKPLGMYYFQKPRNHHLLPCWCFLPLLSLTSALCPWSHSELLKYWDALENKSTETSTNNILQVRTACTF